MGLARTIAISDEVYELLKRSKLPGETFSNVIKRSLHKRKLSDIARSRTLSTADWTLAKEHFAEAELITSRKLSRKS
jgi:predicted CopG family antitoxin